MADQKSSRGWRVEQVAWRDLEIGTVDLPSGVCVRTTLGLGSGLYRNPHDRDGIVWAVTDRGPNIAISQAVDQHGLENLAHLAGIDGAKLQLDIDFAPSIVELRLEDSAVRLVRVLPLTLVNGNAASGRPNPLAHRGGERTFKMTGEEIATDPDGLDPEGIVALSDGTFRVVEEYAPSVLVVDAGGVIRQRWVPEGTAHDLARSVSPILPVLPVVTARRRLNRGFEGIALMPDESEIIVGLQSAAELPDANAFLANRWCRLFRLCTQTGELRAQYAYPLDAPAIFERDREDGEVTSSDVKVSELLAVGADRLIVLERISLTTKLYEVTISEGFALPGQFLDPDYRPSLEMLDHQETPDHGIRALEKRLIFSSDDAPEVTADMEGLALLSRTTLLMSSDNDFGITGAPTLFWRIVFDAPIA